MQFTCGWTLGWVERLHFLISLIPLPTGLAGTPPRGHQALSVPHFTRARRYGSQQYMSSITSFVRHGFSHYTTVLASDPDAGPRFVPVCQSRLPHRP